jgi:hypothetical protein
MRHAIVIMPVGSKNAAQSETDNFNIEFTTHVWRKGIPDPAITSWDSAVECSRSNAPTPPATHLYLWGDVTEAQATALLTVPSAKVYYSDEGWDRWSALADNGLIEMPQPLEEWEQ